MVSEGIAPRHAPASASADVEVLPPGPPSLPPVAGADADEAQSGPLGYEGMVTRQRIAERRAFAHWVAAVRTGQEPAHIAALARVYIEQAEQLRKIEKDLSTVRGSRDGWLPADQVAAAFERMATEIRGALLDLPHTLTPRLAGQPKGKIKTALDRAIHRILTRLANPAGVEETA